MKVNPQIWTAITIILALGAAVALSGCATPGVTVKERQEVPHWTSGIVLVKFRTFGQEQPTVSICSKIGECEVTLQGRRALAPKNMELYLYDTAPHGLRHDTIGVEFLAWPNGKPHAEVFAVSKDFETVGCQRFFLGIPHEEAIVGDPPAQPVYFTIERTVHKTQGCTQFIDQNG